MSTFIVRLSIPDRPGALGSVASRIGAVGGDLVGIDILERAYGRAVDELYVELPSSQLVDLLIREVMQVDGVEVESIRALVGAQPDPRLDALESAIALVEVLTPNEVLATLTRRVHTDVSADWVAVVDHRSQSVIAGDGPVPAASALFGFVRDIQTGSATPNADIAWTLLDGSDLTLLVGRRGRTLRSRERRQLTALARVADLRWVDLISSHLSR